MLVTIDNKLFEASEANLEDAISIKEFLVNKNLLSTSESIWVADTGLNITVYDMNDFQLLEIKVEALSADEW